jgi:hypothetical protein
VSRTSADLSPYPALLDRVLAVTATGVSPQTVSHLVGPSTSDSPYALRHATKLPPRAAVGAGRWDRYLDELASAGDPLIRWLVWLGPAAPPAPPSHLRITTDGGRFAGVVLPLTGAGEPLRVDAARGGAAVSGAGELAWREVQEHTDPPLSIAELRLAGLRAGPHHCQILAATTSAPAEERHVLLIRPRPGAVAPW